MKRAFTSAVAASVVFFACGSNPAGDEALLAAPSLISPAAGVSGAGVTTLLVWSAVAGAGAYDAQVSSDSAFTSTAAACSNVADTSWTAGPLSYETEYFWRVRSRSGARTSAWTAPRSFTTGLEGASITHFGANFAGGDTALVPSAFVLGYSCTLVIRLPERAESIIVKRKIRDTTVLAAALTAADTQRIFSFVSWKFGRDTLVAYTVSGSGGDTALKPFFSPSLYLRTARICHLTACPLFDTLYADTCAYDRDSVEDNSDIAFFLSWPGDTIHGVRGLYRIVKVYGQICIPIPGQGTFCYPVWNRRWIVEYDDGLSHECSDTGSDTLYWSVVNSDQDTVTGPLVLRRAPICL